MILMELFRERVLGHAPRRSIPPMDGAWRPNDRLEECRALPFDVARPTGLASAPDGRLFIASGNRVLLATGPDYASASAVATFPGAVRALAWHPRLNLIAAVSGQGLVTMVDQGNGSVVSDCDGGPLLYPTAVAVAPDGAILATEGSRTLPGEAWVRDLMRKGADGRVVRLANGEGRGTTLADGLAFPSGIGIAPDGTVIVSEAWRHRLLRLTAGKPAVVLDNLPGYPASILPRVGGWWLSLFAPRSHIVEFVLEEDAFRSRMMTHIDPAFWISPSTDPREHHFQPVQVGALRSQNIKKPWAPPRSYGLIVALDDQFTAQTSYHSRSNGTRHGIGALAIAEGILFAACEGANVILMPQAGQE